MLLAMVIKTPSWELALHHLLKTSLPQVPIRLVGVGKDCQNFVQHTVRTARHTLAEHCKAAANSPRCIPNVKKKPM